MSAAEIGIVGGSGLSELAGHEGVEDVVLETPWGPPSGPYRIGTVGGRRVAFLARHGAGHRLMPSEINYRANTWGFLLLGVRRILSVSAVGSLREEIAPRDVVVVDQFIDRTHGRASTFFGGGLVAHVAFGRPTCPELAPLAAAAAREAGCRVHEGGTYVCMEGPQFSTRAESEVHRQWGAHVVGMTNATEAKLAREAGTCYASLALVTDYDCWRGEDEEVSVEMLLGHLAHNARRSAAALEVLVPRIPGQAACACSRALATAVITAPEAVPEATRRMLAPLLERR